jgi:hypothetical protein
MVRTWLRARTGRIPTSTAHSLFIDDSLHGSKVRIARVMTVLLTDVPLVVVVMRKMRGTTRRRGKSSPTVIV